MKIPQLLPISVLSLAAGFGLQAAPSPVSGPLATPGDGLNSKWVEVDFSINPHNVAASEAILALGAGDAGYLGDASFVASGIDFADGLGYGGVTPDVFHPLPFGPADAAFGVRYSGFLNVTMPGDYLFWIQHDDGFKLTLGGEVIGVFDADTAPTSTGTGPISLVAGLYPIEFIGWEQGGAFINELAWAEGTLPPEVIPQENLFTSTGVVPEASTWMAAGLTTGLLAFGAWRRRVGQRHA